MVQLAGYESFYHHKKDLPESVDRLIGEMGRICPRGLWPTSAATDAMILLHGAHFSSSFTPVPVLEGYSLPCFREFSALMHKNGKKELCHADAEMGSLLRPVEEAGFDGTDCLVAHQLRWGATSSRSTICW